MLPAPSLAQLKSVHVPVPKHACPISRIPNEVLGIIFEQVTCTLTHDIAGVLLVSKKWCRVALDRPHVWTRLFIGTTKVFPFLSTLLERSKAAPVTLSVILDDYSVTVDDTWLLDVLAHAHHIYALEILCLRISPAVPLIQNTLFPILHHLALSPDTDLLDGSDEYAVGVRAPQLVGLDLKCAQPANWSNVMGPRLINLDFEDNIEHVEAAVHAAHELCPALKSLRLVIIDQEVAAHSPTLRCPPSITHLAVVGGLKPVKAMFRRLYPLVVPVVQIVIWQAGKDMPRRLPSLMRLVHRGRVDALEVLADDTVVMRGEMEWTLRFPWAFHTHDSYCPVDFACLFRFLAKEFDAFKTITSMRVPQHVMRAIGQVAREYPLACNLTTYKPRNHQVSIGFP